MRLRHTDHKKESKHFRLYKLFHNMKGRCNNPKNTDYKYYGAKGIKVLFKDYFEFKEWSLNNGYNDSLTIDRIDSNGNYEPSNCRWTTMKVQANNRNQRPNKTGYQGVRKKGNKYQSKIYINRKAVNLGSFNTPEEAHQAYLQAKRDVA